MAGQSMFSVKVTLDKHALEMVLQNWPALDQIIAASAAEATLRFAQLFSPVDTGALRASIVAEASGGEWSVDATQPYAGFVEFGTSKMRAQPFMTPAFSAVDYDAIVEYAFKQIGL